MIDFQGAEITSDTGFLLLREIDERFGILGPIGSELEDARSWVHSKHSLLQMARQRVYQIAAGYEDCNEADFLRIDPALRLAIGKGDEAVRIRCAGTRPVAVASPRIRLGCSWMSWRTISCTYSANSTLWAKRSNGPWSG